MELKNVNPNGNNVVASNLINVNSFIFENCENWTQEWRSNAIFSNNAMIAQEKTKFFILFISQINVEWIKAPHVVLDLFYKKKIFSIFLVYL
jgi:hypothetical protein